MCFLPEIFAYHSRIFYLEGNETVYRYCSAYFKYGNQTSNIIPAPLKSSSSAPNSTTQPLSPPGPKLSSGAYIGIGIASGIGAFAIGALLFFLFRRRQRKTALAPKNDIPTSEKCDGVTALAETKPSMHELPAKSLVIELPKNEIFEVDGGSGGKNLQKGKGRAVNCQIRLCH